METCGKCKSEAVFWKKDRAFDTETQEIIEGYWFCMICGKRTFEPKGKENATRF